MRKITSLYISSLPRYRWRPNKVLQFLCLLAFLLVVGVMGGAWLEGG